MDAGAVGHFVIDVQDKGSAKQRASAGGATPGTYWLNTLKNTTAAAPSSGALDWAAWPAERILGEPHCDYVVRWDTKGGEFNVQAGQRADVRGNHPGCALGVLPGRPRTCCWGDRPACPRPCPLAGATPTDCSELEVPFSATYTCLQCPWGYAWGFETARG